MQMSLLHGGGTSHFIGVTPCKRLCGWGAGNPPNPPEQSTPSSVLREPVGFKVNIQQSLLIGTGGVMKMSTMPEDLPNLEGSLWLIFETRKALFS